MSLYIPQPSLLIPLFLPLYLALMIGFGGPYRTTPKPLLLLGSLLNIYLRFLPGLLPYLTTHHPRTPPAIFNLFSNWEVKLVMFLRICAEKDIVPKWNVPWWKVVTITLLWMPYSQMSLLGDSVSTESLLGSRDGSQLPKVRAWAWAKVWGQGVMHIGLCVALIGVGYGEERGSVWDIIKAVFTPRWEDNAGVVPILQFLKQWLVDAARAVLVWITCVNLKNWITYFWIARTTKGWQEVNPWEWDKMRREEEWKGWGAVFGEKDEEWGEEEEEDEEEAEDRRRRMLKLGSQEDKKVEERRRDSREVAEQEGRPEKNQAMAMAHKWDTRWTMFKYSQHEQEQDHWKWFVKREPLDQRDWNEVLNHWERMRTTQQDVSWRMAIALFRDVDKDDEIQPDKVLIIRLSDEEFAHFGISLPARESDDERNTNVPRKTRDFLALVLGDKVMLVGLPGMPPASDTRFMQKEIEAAEERERGYDERDRQRAAACQEGN
ncbi:hypothetical protein L211DRAFT_841641, partial [Terfezia boudieri ATCC MYA-4762]